MSERYFLVVGDKFSGFAAGKSAVTLSQLKGVLTLPGGLLASGDRLILIPGQGLGDRDVAEIADLAESSALAGCLDLSLWSNAPKRADGCRSHKRHVHNTTISEPWRVAEDTFEMDVLIDDEGELMSDHQTGQHIQGMILFEAARQSFLAVTEAFYLPQDGEKRYFVIDEMSVRYKRFVFPYAAKLRYVVREAETIGRRFRFVVEAAVLQGGAEAATFTMGFSVNSEARLMQIEAGLAETGLAEHLMAVAAARVADDIAEAA